MDIEKRIYEFSYLLVPTVAEEAVPAKLEALKKLFTDKGAEIVSDEAPEYIGLAYTMIHKVNNKNERINSAYFGWFKINIDPEMLDEIKAIIDRDIDVLRYMVVKTVAENTMAPKKLSQKRDVQKKTYRNTESSEVVATEEALVDDTQVEKPEFEEEAVKEPTEDVENTKVAEIGEEE